MIKITEGFFKQVFEEALHLKEDTTFDFIQATLLEVLNGNHVHDENFINNFCRQRIAQQRNLTKNGQSVSNDFLEGDSIKEYYKKTIKSLARMRHFGSRTGAKLSRRQAKEIRLFLLMYVVLVQEKVDAGEIHVEAGPHLNNTVQDVSRWIQKFLNN